MPTAFVVITRDPSTWHQVGIRENYEPFRVHGPGPTIVFHRGRADFPFRCPGVDATRNGVLSLNTRSIDHFRNYLAVNGHGIPSALLVTRSNEDWSANTVVVPPGVLGEDNTLTLQARDPLGGIGDDVDEFLVANIILFYKTRAFPRLPLLRRG